MKFNPLILGALLLTITIPAFADSIYFASDGIATSGRKTIVAHPYIQVGTASYWITPSESSKEQSLKALCAVYAPGSEGGEASLERQMVQTATIDSRGEVENFNSFENYNNYIGTMTCWKNR